MLAPAMCEACGLAFDVDPHAGEVACHGCGGPVYLVSVEDLAGDELGEVDEVDLVAAELAALVEREELLAEVAEVFDHAGLAGLSAAVDQLDEVSARECLFVAVVQLAEAGALDELAGMN